MRRSTRQAASAIKERLAMGEEIEEKFGEKAIVKAKRRLCCKCKEMDCFLLPITTDGKDCPYFKQREGKK